MSRFSSRQGHRRPLRNVVLDQIAQARPRRVDLDRRNARTNGTQNRFGDIRKHGGRADDENHVETTREFIVKPVDGRLRQHFAEQHHAWTHDLPAVFAPWRNSTVAGIGRRSAVRAVAFFQRAVDLDHV